MATKTREQINAEAVAAGIENAESFGSIAAVQAAIDASAGALAEGVTALGGTPVQVLDVQAQVEVERPRGDDPDAILAYLAKPASTPYPEGLVINFGDPQPFRHAPESETE